MSQPIKKMNQLGKIMSELTFLLNQPKNEAVMVGWHQVVGLAEAALERGPLEKRVLTVLM